MKLSGTAALYTQKKELEAALAITNRQIAMAEEFDAPKPEKKARRKRTPKVNGSDQSDAFTTRVKAHQMAHDEALIEQEM